MSDKIYVDANTVFIVPDDDVYKGSRRTSEYLKSTPARRMSEQLLVMLKSRPITGQYSDPNDFIEAYHAWTDQVRALTDAIEA